MKKEFVDARARQAHAQRQKHDGAGQTGADQAPLSERDLVPEWIVGGEVVRGARRMPARAGAGIQRVARDRQVQPDLVHHFLGDIDRVPGGVCHGIIVREAFAAAGTGVGIMRGNVGMGQLLGTPESLGANLLAGFLRGGVFASV